MARKTERMLKQEQEAHHFALWVPEIDLLPTLGAQEYTIMDQALVQRVRRILRLEQHDELTLFGYRQSIRATICSLSSHACTVRYDTPVPIKAYDPSIRLCLPLLEKAAFEEAVRRATVLGVTHIQPIITEKTKRRSMTPVEIARIERIMIAAAEQSKQLYLPRLEEVQLLHKLIFQGDIIGFDYARHSLCSAPFLQQNAGGLSVSVAIGPEADFTLQEKQWLSQSGCAWYQLTESVLRSEDALMVGIGMLRTCWAVQGKQL